MVVAILHTIHILMVSMTRVLHFCVCSGLLASTRTVDVSARL